MSFKTELAPMTCRLEGCRRLVKQKPGPGRVQLYCSHIHASRGWRRIFRQDEIRMKLAAPPVKCALKGCSEPVTPSLVGGPRRKYCSPQHRNRSRYVA